MMEQKTWKSYNQLVAGRHLGDKDGRTFEPSGAEIGEGLIGLVQRIACGFGDNADFGCQTKEIDSILSREIGNRYELPLFP